MDVRDFGDLIDRLGEDLSCWPDAERLAALDLLAVSPEARALQQEAELLRQALSAPPVRAPAGLADRIFAAAARVKVDAPPADQASEPDRAGVRADVSQPG